MEAQRNFPPHSVAKAITLIPKPDNESLKKIKHQYPS